MATFFTFGILLAVFRSECFELLVKQVPSPAYEHDHVTLSASYSGFEETEHPTRVVWGIISPLQSVGRILLPGCTVFGPIDISAYNFTCSEGELTWTIFNVSRSQQGQIWSCMLATNVNSVQAELALKLHDPLMPTLEVSPETVQEYHSVTLMCTIYDQVIPVSWAINGQHTGIWIGVYLGNCTTSPEVLPSDYNCTCISAKMYSCTIKNVTRAQHGDKWKCLANNAKGITMQSGDVEVKVLVGVSAVQLTKPTEIEVIEAEHFRVLFECVSEGLPAPTIRWFMDNKTPNNTDDDVELKLNSSSIIRETKQNADNTYRVKSQLDFTIDRKFDGMEIYCTTNNTARVLISTRRPVIRVQYSQLFIENPVNCGEPAILRCRSSSATTSIWNFKLNGNSIVSSTTTIDFNSVYSESTDLDGTITLVVRNTSVHDRGSYTCQISSYPESQPVGLEFECKPKALEINVTVDAKIRFMFDNVYPIPTEVVVTVFSQFKEEFTCGYVSCKQNNEGYHNCVWNSNRNFRRGTYTYVVDMQFITKTDSLAGSFTIDMNPSNESLTLETTHRVKDSTPDINVTCTYTGNRTVYVVSWYRNRALVGAVNPSCAILIRPHFDRYQFICPSPFETVLSVEKLILNQTVDKWTCQVGLGFGNVLESSPVDILLEATEGSDQLESNSETVKVVGGVIGGFVTGWLVGIASVFLVHKMRLIEKCMAEKETADIPTKLAAAHQKESLPNENEQEQDTNTNPSDYQNTMGTAGSDQTAGNTGPYESLQERNQEQYDIILQY
ncbi:uncharacterized protein LOC128234028 isoform X1 [Mya arenaria]|uniref:uncharacterized protein LOC128234028 isoform X1 n=1 Tax=Mya arenaria TaxID=6604 RepID=UPI0022E28047|nr:uncharacterized protein LOC128234028 isoform X1 [Mya arenaria]